MTVHDVEQALSLRLLAGETGDTPVESAYIGDLLSWVMSRAPAKCAWITVMGNVNAIAVAKLADISCIILCENASLDDDAKAQAVSNDIPVFSSEESAYTLAVWLSELLKKG